MILTGGSGSVDIFLKWSSHEVNCDSFVNGNGNNINDRFTALCPGLPG